MKILKLTNKEVRALQELVLINKVCSCGCVYPEMETSRKDCDDCEFEKSRRSILEKIEDIII